jgi:hypothetical protein
MWAVLAGTTMSEFGHLRVRSGIDAFSDFGKSCILFFLTMYLVDTPRKLRRIIWVVVISAGVLCIHGILQVRGGEGFGGKKPFGSLETGDLRIQGTGMFEDPNDFATLFVMATPLVVTLLGQSRNVISKFILICILPLILCVFYFTNSRGGVVGFCVMLLAYLWVGRKVSLGRVILTSGLLAAAVLAGPARARGTIYDASAGSRVATWGYGIQALKENPLFGVGYKNWYKLGAGIAPHNSFVLCYAENGLVGYVPWFALSWLVVRSVARVPRLRGTVHQDSVRIARGLFACVAGYMTCTFFLTRTYYPPQYFLFGLAVALTRIAQQEPGVRPEFFKITTRDVRRAAIAALLSIPGIWLFSKLYSLGRGG